MTFQDTGVEGPQNNREGKDDAGDDSACTVSCVPFVVY